MHTWDVIMYRDVKYCDCTEIWDAILFEMSDIVTVLWDMLILSVIWDIVFVLRYCVHILIVKE